MIRPAVAGVDGCRTGWVVATMGRLGVGSIEIEVVGSIAVVVDRVRAGLLAAVAIDIPIGLPTAGSRACDIAARRFLPGKASSVFPAPLRCVLGTGSYPEALALSRAAPEGKGLSKQAWFLVRKIAEADAAVRPDERDRIVEASPELCFAAMAGAPILPSKRTSEGRALRQMTLAHVGLSPPAGRAVARGAAIDDVLDACALLWTADRVAAGEAVHLGGPAVDGTGQPMRITY